jgi:GNAT superfamily N-acetyltransferase
MAQPPGIPDALRLSFDVAPSPETRSALGQEINAFHARTVPHDARRFALLLRDAEDHLAAGLSGVLSWQWLFVEALWVGDAWRRRGIGRALLARAEVHAAAAGCHSAWLDTFQARAFYHWVIDNSAPWTTIPPARPATFCASDYATTTATRRMAAHRRNKSGRKG